MKKGKFLGEALSYDSIEKGRLNMVVAQTGQGKTTMASHYLPEKLGITNHSRILYLIDTIMGRDMLEKEDIFQSFPPKDKEKIVIMTYAKFGALLKDYTIYTSMFDLIIADEFHNLYKYAQIDMSKMIKANPDFSNETLVMMLSRESNNYKALEALKRWSENSSLYVVAMTATPENFLQKDKELNDLIAFVRAEEQLIAYEILARHTYTNAEEVLIGCAKEGEKRLIFTHTVNQALSFKQLIEENTNRKVMALWSPSNKEQIMSEEQYEVRQHLIDNESFPDDIDDIALTGAYETGWNLYDTRVSDVIIHSGDKTFEKQGVGRLRQDTKNLYVYSKDESKNKKREKENQKILEEDWIIPSHYLNVSLSSEDREDLIKEIGFPKKWTSLKKWIEQSEKYELEKKRIKGYDFFIIKSI